MQVETDKKDLKILAELERDARQSYGEIAKKTGLSKEVVLYRVRNLERSKVIRGYITEINMYRLGYRAYPVLLKFSEMAPEKEKEMTAYLRKSGVLGWAARCEGTWDMNLVIVAKNATRVADFFNDFEAGYGDCIIDKAFMHTVSLNYFKRSFGNSGLESEKRERITTEEGVEEAEISAKEEKLLGLMAGNARKSTTELCRAVGASPPTVMAMIKRLKKAGIIQGYRVFTDFGARGYEFRKMWLCMKNMTKEDWRTFYSFLGINPQVLWATRTIGYYDFSIELEAPSAKEFRDFVGDLGARFHDKIHRRDIISVYEEILLRYFPANPP